MTKVVYYTDGASSHNGTPNAKAGWGWVQVENNEPVAEGFGHIAGGTNNQGELLGIIEALRHAKTIVGDCFPQAQVIVHSDSAYCINGMRGIGGKNPWVLKWESLGWKRDTKGSEVKNLEMWQELLAFDRELDIIFVKVKGHSGDKFNEYVDRLAVKAKGC